MCLIAVAGGYGFCHIPTAPGTFEIDCPTWLPEVGLLMVAKQQHGTDSGDDSSINADGSASRDSNSSNVLQAASRPCSWMQQLAPQPEQQE
jgi:hypothetical protein